MSLSLEKRNKIIIIDRTLPEILSKKHSKKRLEIIYFCWILKEIGVDFIEIDAKFLEFIPKLPFGLNFLLRVKSEEDVLRSIKRSIKHCIFSEEFLKDTELLRQAKNCGIKTTVEIDITKLSEIDKVKNLCQLDLVDDIRLHGMDLIFNPLWIEKVKNLSKELNKVINICPKNMLYNATALCVEGIMNGIDSITVSFLGYGKNKGFAALEEVLAAIKVILNADQKLDLSRLPEAAVYFTSLSGVCIPENKPIVGKRIFDYQAGIHADAIEKDPMTYEPFDPSMVGLTRELTIGKHSGKRAVQKKLKELGVVCKVEEAAKILNSIREKSSQCKRDLYDEEILDIYKSVEFMGLGSEKL